MKTEYLFVILLVLIGFSSCEDSTSDATLELSQSTFENISSDGATLTVNITSSDSWTAASSSTACNLVPNQGTSNQSLSIVVEANLDEAERNMTVVVTSGGIKKTISISQQGRSTTAGEYHYNLPVILSGKSRALLPPSPLRTVRESFPSYGSSNSIFLFVVRNRLILSTVSFISLVAVVMDKLPYN